MLRSFIKLTIFHALQLFLAVVVSIFIGLWILSFLMMLGMFLLTDYTTRLLRLACSSMLNVLGMLLEFCVYQDLPILNMTVALWFGLSERCASLAHFLRSKLSRD